MYKDEYTKCDWNMTDEKNPYSSCNDNGKEDK